MNASNKSRRDYFAMNAPVMPAWFFRKTITFDSNEPAGIITRYAETEEEHYIRWRWHYAYSMITGSEKFDK